MKGSALAFSYPYSLSFLTMYLWAFLSLGVPANLLPISSAMKSMFSWISLLCQMSPMRSFSTLRNLSSDITILDR